MAARGGKKRGLKVQNEEERGGKENNQKREETKMEGRRKLDKDEAAVDGRV